MRRLFLLLTILGAFTLVAVAQDASQDKSRMSGSKDSTLTGCVSASPTSDGMYTLTNGHYKKGVEIGPADKVKEHAGHQVSLTGKWNMSAAGEASAASTREKGERHFEVDSVKHIADTCSPTPTGAKKKAKSEKKPG